MRYLISDRSYLSVCLCVQLPNTTRVYRASPWPPEHQGRTVTVKRSSEMKYPQQELRLEGVHTPESQNLMPREIKICNTKGENHQTQARIRLTTVRLTTHLNQEPPQDAPQRAAPSPLQLDRPPLNRRSVQGALSFMTLIFLCNF